MGKNVTPDTSLEYWGNSRKYSVHGF